MVRTVRGVFGYVVARASCTCKCKSRSRLQSAMSAELCFLLLLLYMFPKRYVPFGAFSGDLQTYREVRLVVRTGRGVSRYVPLGPLRVCVRLCFVPGERLEAMGRVRCAPLGGRARAFSLDLTRKQE
jgi:hypothetical protein